MVGSGRMRLSRNVLGPLLGLALVVFVLVGAQGWGPQGNSPNGSLGEQALRGLTPLERAILADKKVTAGRVLTCGAGHGRLPANGWLHGG